MASTNRAALPQEFFDITSDMLLVQPEPQYLHAKLWKAAVGAELSPSGLIGAPQRPGFGGEGADYSSLEADRLMLSDPLATSIVKAVVEIGKAPGHTVRLNRPSYTNSTYTQASREVPSGSTISTTGIAVGSEQTSLTLKRFAGPYSSSVQPYAIEKFDSNLSIHKMAQIHGVNLKRDFDKTIDSFMVALCDLGANVVRPRGMTADNDSVVAGDFPMDWNTLSRASQKADELNLPTWPDGKRMIVLTPQQVQQLSDDSQWGRYAQFVPSLNPVFGSSYYKSAGDLHVFKSNTLTTSANSSSVNIHYAQLLAPGVLGTGVGELPRVAYAAEDNYGETAKVIWLLYAAFGLLDNRFAISVRTS